MSVELPLPSSSKAAVPGSPPDVSAAGSLGGHWKGTEGTQTTTMLGLEDAPQCFAGHCGRATSGKLWCCPGVLA